MSHFVTYIYIIGIHVTIYYVLFSRKVGTVVDFLYLMWLAVVVAVYLAAGLTPMTPNLGLTKLAAMISYSVVV